MARRRKIKNRTLRGKFRPVLKRAKPKRRLRPRGRPFEKENKIGPRWAKGCPSPNPGGRPRSAKISESSRNLLKTSVNEPFVIQTRSDEVVYRAYLKAKGGDMTAFRELGDRSEGKPTNTVVMSEGPTILREAIDSFDARYELNQLQQAQEGGEALMLTEGQTGPEQVEAQDGDLLEASR
jgi:Family of unknown function (DUF5681)